MLFGSKEGIMGTNMASRAKRIKKRQARLDLISKKCESLLID
tara:strand:+ start:325 stop:450 length:126 start_codon:yes stop_codon:yes gene_type:complete